VRPSELPIKDRLRDPADEQALHRMWRSIDARFPQAGGGRRWWGVLALTSAVAVAVAAAVLVPRRDVGPLRLADGRAILPVEAPAPQGLTLATSDGSSIQLTAGARFEPLESSSTTFIAMLRRGSASFDIRPGGPRRWEIECGLATVEVLGTRFTCERNPGRLRVAVQRGVVLVRGDRVPDRARRLPAGESLEVFEAPPAVETPLAPARAAAPPPDRTATAAVPSAPAPARWRELARSGRNQEAFAALGPHGVRRESSRLAIEDLFALSDVARLSGHPDEAVAPLERILAEFSRDPQASLAAFALGRLELDALGQPERAAPALRRALELGIPRTLKEDVRSRLVEAYARMGDSTGARAAADAYAREFPNGRYARTIESRLAGAQ
jgi:transmembrane sensor